MKKSLTILLAFTLLIVSQLHGQIFSKSETFKGTVKIKGKYFNGSGGNGYWDIKTLDSLGRTINEKSYKKKELLSETKSIYDINDDELVSINVYDINNPNIIDTNWIRTYKYSGSEIIEEIIKYSEEDSTIIKLVENINDSLITYTEASYHFREKANKNWVHITEHKITKDKKGLKIKWVKEDKDRKIITDFEYYPNRKIKRRIITRIPEYTIKGIYTGGPGSDDQSWEYEYDKKGRIKFLYTIVDNNKYKIAKYKYE